jgi:parvulin-like peptidyl-prolyl isomerase
MKRILALIVVLGLLVVGCGKKQSESRLEKGTPAYNLADSISKTLPYLDPNKNNPIVTTKTFTVNTADVFTAIVQNYGSRSEQLKTLDADHLKTVIQQNAIGIAEQDVLLNEAQKVGVSITDAQVDSVLNQQYELAGGEQAFLDWLSKNEISPDIVRQDILKSLTINTYIETILTEIKPVAEADVLAIYNADKTASVRHILLLTQGKSDSDKAAIHQQMETLLARAKAGEDFSELAKQYSEDPGSKENGGLYQDFPKGQMVPPFEEAAFTVPIGELSGIIETRYGYHILKVIDRKKETRPLEEVRAEIEQQLQNDQRNVTVQELMDSLKTKVDFKVMEF